MKHDYEELYLVGIGASAGGIEAIRAFLSSITDNKPIAYIICQHLNPQYKSMLSEILSRETKLEVIEIYQGLDIQADKIYVTPPNANVTVRNGLFFISIPEQIIGPKPSIDLLFNSLAQEKGQKAIGVVLSGTGTDGTNGLKAIKNSGGLSIAQDPKSAKYEGMPLSAIDAKAVDKVMLPEEMAPFIYKFITLEDKIDDINISSNALNGIFSILNSAFDIDFSSYKLSTIVRRIEKRMNNIRAKNLDEYLEYLQKNPSEASLLYNEMLIGVTSFYRDAEAFEALANAFRAYLETHTYQDIRIWSAGCATGEEAYSLIMIVSDICENLGKSIDIQVFATDIDEASLATARTGVYPEIISTAIPSRFLEKYFKKKGHVYEVIRPIREKVIFSKHNLLKDPPFLRLDLICCRNLLIYLESAIQQKTILTFHHSLRAGGILFLGKSESLGKASAYFSTISSKYKIFKAKSDIKPHLFDVIITPSKKNQPIKYQSEPQKEITIEESISKVLFDWYINKCVVVDENGNLLYVKGDLDGIASLPKGAVNLNFSKMIAQDLSVEFRSLLFKAIKTKTPQKGRGRAIQIGEKKKQIVISIFPISTPFNGYLCIFDEGLVDLSDSSLNFISDEHYRQLQEELESTKEHLQTVIEELETSNEELQATNEELQSSNEELQATNEELETSNEELQSSNEELQTAYIELKMVYEEQSRQRALLEEANKELIRLNNELNAKEHYISALLDAEQAMVIVTRKGEEIIDANQGFFNFFTQFSSIDEFKLYHKCICELFEEVKDDDTFLTPGPIQKNGKNWVDVVMNSGSRQKKVLFKKDGKSYIFSVHANDLDVINQKYVVVFSNITDIEAQKSIDEQERRKAFELMHQKERVQILRALLFGTNELLNNMMNSWRDTFAKIANELINFEEDATYLKVDSSKIKALKESILQQLSLLIRGVEKSKEHFVISKNRDYFDLVTILREWSENLQKELEQKEIKVRFECNKDRIDFYGYLDEMRFVIFSLFLIYKRLLLSSENKEELIIGIWTENNSIYINFSVKDPKLALQERLIELLNYTFIQNSEVFDFDGIRMKLVCSIIESDLNGTIEPKHNNDFTNLLISLKLKSF